MTENRSRRWPFVVIGIAALLVITPVAALLMLPAERIGAFAAARASTALGRDVSVERFGVRVLPRPAIALSGVTVAGPAAGDPALAAAQRVELRPQLLPLLRRQVVIDDVLLDQLTLLIDVAADGSTNLPVIENDGDGETSGDAELDIRHLRVRDGNITYRNAVTGDSVALAGITQNLTLSGSITAGDLSRLAVSGDLSIDDIDATMPGTLAWPVRDLRLRLEHSADLDRTTDRLDVTRLAVTVQELVLNVTGSVAALSDSTRRTLDLRAGTGRVDIAQFIASLPRALTESASGDLLTGAAGHAQLDVAVTGRMGAGAVPDVAGVLQLEDGAIARGRHGTIASALNGHIAFSQDSIASSGVTGRLLGEALEAAFSVHDFAAPHGRVMLKTALAMAEAEKLGLLPDDSRGSGRIALDVSTAGAFAEPAELALHGSVDMTGIELQVASIEQPVVVQNGRITLAGRGAAAKDLRAVIGASDVALDFDAVEWLPFALGDTLRPPTITFDARSALFDADEIFGVSTDEHTYGELFFARLADRPVGGRTAAEAAEASGLGMPDVPPITMRGRIRATRLVRGGVPFDDVDVSIAALDRVIDVTAASFRMMGGGVHLTGRLGLATGARTASGGVAAQPLVLDYAVNDVAAGAFLERFTLLRDHIAGDMLLAGSLSMNLDSHLLPVRESVLGDGTLAIQAGEIANWPLLQKLGERIGVARFDTLRFRDWTGRFRMAGPRFMLEESVLESGEMAVRASGSFDVNGTLDLGATLHLPQSWAARVPGAPAAFLVNAAAGADGRVPVGARFTGTARDPAIALDLSEAGARVANAAREAAQDQARDLAARATNELTGRLLPRDSLAPASDSLATAADSAKKKVEDEVVNRLRRLIRPPGGG